MSQNAGKCASRPAFYLPKTRIVFSFSECKNVIFGKNQFIGVKGKAEKS